MRIVFEAPNLQHPNSDKTIYEIACALEEKYHLLELYFEDIEDELCSFILRQIVEGRFHIPAIQDFVKNKWRAWMLDKGHHLGSKAAAERGDPPFIDTSSYYLSMSPILEFTTRKEKNVAKKLTKKNKL